MVYKYLTTVIYTLTYWSLNSWKTVFHPRHSYIHSCIHPRHALGHLFYLPSTTVASAVPHVQMYFNITSIIVIIIFGIFVSKCEKETRPLLVSMMSASSTSSFISKRWLSFHRSTSFWIQDPKETHMSTMLRVTMFLWEKGRCCFSCCCWWSCCYSQLSRRLHHHVLLLAICVCPLSLALDIGEMKQRCKTTWMDLE